VTNSSIKASDNNPPSDEIKKILENSKKIAIVGLSPKEDRDSNKVAKYLLDKGYDIVPVNPGQKEILGKSCYKSITDIPFPVDVVDLFLNPKRVPPIVDQAIEIGAPILWMQIGVIHNEAAQEAREAGLTVIMDICIKDEHEKLFPEPTS
jgi:predicted CoA-binding protein